MNISSRQTQFQPLLKDAALSKAKLDNREFFKNQFRDDFIRNPSKTSAFADQYYDKFKLHSGYQKNLQGLTSINDVLLFLQEMKTPLSPKKQKLQNLKNSFPILEKDIDKLGNSNIELSNYDIAVKFLMSTEQDEIDEIISSISIYQKNVAQLDKPLSSFNLLSELRSYLDNKLSDNKELYLSGIKSEAVDPKNVDYIYDSLNFLVVLPGTVKSSQYFADKTNWCTGTIKDNMFANYSSSNVYLYYIITKQDSPKFEQSEPKRKMSLGYVKKNGKPILSENEYATVSADNHALRLNEIMEYLGTEANAIINSINKDLSGRQNTKFEEILENMTPDEFKLAAATNRIDNWVVTLKKIIEKCVNHETKQLALESFAKEEPYDFLLSYADEDFARPYLDMTAKNFSEKEPIYFLAYFANKDFAKPYIDISASNIAEKEPHKFLMFFSDKKYAKPYIDIAAKNCSERDPRNFLVDFSKKYPQYEPHARSKLFGYASDRHTMGLVKLANALRTIGIIR